MKTCDVCIQKGLKVKRVEIYKGKIYVCQDCGEAMAKAFVSTSLKKEERKELVDKLTQDTVECIAEQLGESYAVETSLWDIIETGFKGFANMSDKELLKAHQDKFDEEYEVVRDTD